MNDLFPTPDTEARQLREELYGPITDESWDKVRDNWIRDLDWRCHS